MRKLKLPVKAVYHYSVDDPHFVRDYYSVQLFVGDRLFLDLGDDYHDKSYHQIKGAIEAFKMHFDVEFTQERIADQEY